MLRRLRPHQVPAFAYMLRWRNPAPWLEMRLGKCIITIRRILLIKPRNPALGLRILVVAPNSALGSWEKELPQEMQPCILRPQGSSKARLQIIKGACATAHTNVWILLNKESHLGLPQIARMPWDAVVLDESNFISNPTSKASKFYCNNFRDPRIHRFSLTGMPRPESDLQYFQQLKWLDGSAFGYDNFYKWRAKECEKDLSGNWKVRDVPAMLHTVGTRTYILSRKDAGIHIPSVREVRELVLPPAMRRMYDLCESDFVLPGKETIWATTKYTWLRRITGGVIDGEVKWDGKLQELVSLLMGELRGVSVVVVFFYNDELQAAKAALIEAGMAALILTLRGDVPTTTRERIREAWENTPGGVLLVQQAVISSGMNLSQSDTMIFYSENPSCLGTFQAQDRIVDTAKRQALLYVYLVVKNSVDSDLRETLPIKRWASDSSLRAALMERLCARVRRKV